MACFRDRPSLGDVPFGLIHAKTHTDTLVGRLGMKSSLLKELKIADIKVGHRHRKDMGGSRHASVPSFHRESA